MEDYTLTDQQCLDTFQTLLSTRVKLGTAYITDPETGVLTHQVLVITAGEISVHSAPEPLKYPLLPIINQPDNITIQ